MSTHFFVDLETTVNGGPNKDSPEAHWLTNEVLLCGWRTDTGEYSVDDSTAQLAEEIQECIDVHGTAWFIAHNAKFDLKYMMRDNPDVEWQYVQVWDTMTYHYRNSGHNSKFISLEALAEHYSIKFTKSLDLGAILDSGIKMEDIPEEDLLPYLKDDVRVLAQIYMWQYANKYRCEMSYIIPLADMELNGMHIDKPSTEDLMEDLTYKVQAANNVMWSHIKSVCEWQDGTPIIDEDFTTLGTKSKCIRAYAERTTSMLLTGSPSELKITAKWRVRFKEGFSPMMSEHEIIDCFGAATTPKTSGFSMNEYHLRRVLASCPMEKLPQLVLDYRTDNKLLSTYISPFLTTAKVQGTIHPKLNTTGTATGRLSSSGPNGQNIPSIARRCVTARKEGWGIQEMDFSQLEMLGVACVAGEKKMIADLLAGEDLHYNTGKKVMGWASPSDMTKAERTIVKNVNFGVLYGGKATGLSIQTGADKKVVQDLINSFYRTYPRIAVWQREVFEEVVKNMKTHDIKDGEQRYKSIYDDPFSGRRFCFVEATSPPWLRRRTGRKHSFSPQQTSNYPIQGFAGGDIVMTALLTLWRELRGSHRDKVKFIMTVHDSIILEVEKGTDLTEAMDRACAFTKDKFKLPLDLNYDVETSATWQ